MCQHSQSIRLRLRPKGIMYLKYQRVRMLTLIIILMIWRIFLCCCQWIEFVSSYLENDARKLTENEKNIKGAWVLISKPTVFCTILLPCMNFQLILPCQQQLDYVFSSSAIALRIRLSWNWWKKVHTNRIRAQAQELLEVYTSDFWLQLMFS